MTVSQCDGRLFRCLAVRLRDEWREVARARTGGETGRSEPEAGASERLDGGVTGREDGWGWVLVVRDRSSSFLSLAKQ